MSASAVMTSIAIVDYGMGNLQSVAKAFDFLGGRATVTSRPEAIRKADAVVFPGVGAFGEAMAELKKRRLVKPLQEAIQSGKPFLGLCLGLQLLLESSEEAPGVRGLGILRGKVRRLPLFGVRHRLKVPHMGWNQIEWKGLSPRQNEGGQAKGTVPLLKGIPNGAFVYFVHSFYADPQEEDVVVARTSYGCSFPSILSNGKNLWATQFHPEKSQKWGLKILDNFIRVI